MLFLNIITMIWRAKNEFNEISVKGDKKFA